MIHEWQDDLIVVASKSEVAEAEVYLDMDTFDYLKIPTGELSEHRLCTVVGETKKDAYNKAKDYLEGQLGFF